MLHSKRKETVHHVRESSATRVEGQICVLLLHAEHGIGAGEDVPTEERVAVRGRGGRRDGGLRSGSQGGGEGSGG